MTQSIIEVLLKSKIGFDASSISSGMIARAIAQRMAHCKITEIESYLGNLQESTQEWEALIESVIVPETWFFRERESFNFLKSYVLSEWLPTQPKGVLRVLSIPCSTGEEPYSIAIALLEAGLTATKIHIDAVDISKNSLLAAQRAIYGKNSFRGNTVCFQERYFQPTETGYHLCEQIRQMVNFIYGNLADPHFLAGTSPYDIVFCRNLLIYFDPATKKRTLRVLERLVTPEGLLFLGHAEAGLLLNTRFIPVCHPRAFAYRKSVIQASDAPKEPLRDRKPTWEKHRPTLQKTPLKGIGDSPEETLRVDASAASHRVRGSGNRGFLNPIGEQTIKQPQSIKINTENLPKDSQPNLLATAKTLANQGNLAQAAQLCNNYLSETPDSAEAYVTLGEVQQAMGQNQQAAQSFQKALYLQPTSEEALTHLALLKEHQGDGDSAALLWQRIHRLQKSE
ncbi:CheR family methyltransferase [Pelatocladus sp. BLCC-F211]|uniref:CheR family methyltransferase n=1 Tax=Pelatocladus sp. BLCC-F211 TaxID=3342752 RepID=UPI0035BB9007